MPKSEVGDVHGFWAYIVYSRGDGPFIGAEYLTNMVQNLLAGILRTEDIVRSGESKRTN